tara:strand:+ start:359 stop:565 length:207 start_codon:yes stop_codon:yes gene_type:complete
MKRNLNDNNWRFTASLMNDAGGGIGVEKPLKAPPFGLKGGSFEDHPDCQRDRLPSWGYIHINKIRRVE